MRMWSALPVVAVTCMSFGHFGCFFAVIAAILFAFSGRTLALGVRALRRILAHDFSSITDQIWATVYPVFPIKVKTVVAR